MAKKYAHHFWQRFSPLSEIMNIFKGHFGFFEKDFKLSLVEFHLVLGFEHPHFNFQINLDMMHESLCKYKQGLNWGCDTLDLRPNGCMA